MADFMARDDLTDAQKACFPVYIEIQDAATAMPRNIILGQLGGAGAMEIATILTKFEDQIDDEWRHNLIRVGAGLLRLVLDARDE
jgi:hypothetical protein